MKNVGKICGIPMSLGGVHLISGIVYLRLGTRPGNSSLARKIRVSGTKMAYSILENSIQVITFFRVDISEVNYATC